MLTRCLPDKGDVEDLTKEFIAESQEGLERMELCLTELERRPGDGELLSEIFRTVHTIKGTTGFLGFSRLGTLAHAGESLLVALRDGKIAVTSELISGLLELLDGLRKILRLIEATGTEGERSAEDDELIALLATFKAGGGSLAAEVEPTSQNRDAGRLDLSATAETSLAQQRTLRIDVEVLNRMMNLVGELVLTRNHILLSSPGSENFPELARRLNSVTAELRESVMHARMQPVGYLFGKFPRMVRDLAKTCGRRVRIEFEGRETGLDKSLLDAIRDPLTHAVRNSIGHGIEPPEERVKAGKPVEGLVRLRAFHQNGSVVIEVIDDGAGISTERVLAKAIERGLVTQEQAGSMTQREALRMIFVAGFSMAKEVTNVSGRGVGMDVVRTNVEQVGGSVELESRVGSGTTVRLRVPLTLAIVPALVVRSGGQSFAVPQNSLIELVYVPARDAATAVERIGTAEVYRLRESLLPLVWLDRVLGLERSVGVASHSFYIAVLESEGRRFGLVVDDLKAPEEIVVKPLSAVLSQIGMFSGATVLGNGMLAMILDVAATGARAGVQAGAEAAKVSDEGTMPARSEASRVEPARIEMESSMVIYEAWKRGSGGGSNPARMAMPLSAVERIERVPLSKIEYADGRAVWQCGGELVPLEDEDEVLLELRAANQSAESIAGEEGAMATVLICLRPRAHAVRRVGMVVRRVLDVSAGTLLAADPELCEGQLAMVKDLVTTVHREFAEQVGGPAFAVLQEVA
jgi:two-component system chemotaxis sensor kinase CheA